MWRSVGAACAMGISVEAVNRLICVALDGAPLDASTVAGCSSIQARSRLLPAVEGARRDRDEAILACAVAAGARPARYAHAPVVPVSSS